MVSKGKFICIIVFLLVIFLFYPAFASASTCLRSASGSFSPRLVVSRLNSAPLGFSAAKFLAPFSPDFRPLALSTCFRLRLSLLRFPFLRSCFSAAKFPRRHPSVGRHSLFRLPPFTPFPFHLPSLRLLVAVCVCSFPFLLSCPPAFLPTYLRHTRFVCFASLTSCFLRSAFAFFLLSLSLFLAFCRFLFFL